MSSSKFLWVPIALLLAASAALASDYKTVRAAEFQTMLSRKDFFLLDVHIPVQKHIPGTGSFIDYRRIKENGLQVRC